MRKHNQAVPSSTLGFSGFTTVTVIIIGIIVFASHFKPIGADNFDLSNLYEKVNSSIYYGCYLYQTGDSVKRSFDKVLDLLQTRDLNNVQSNLESFAESGWTLPVTVIINVLAFILLGGLLYLKLKRTTLRHNN